MPLGLPPLARVHRRRPLHLLFALPADRSIDRRTVHTSAPQTCLLGSARATLATLILCSQRLRLSRCGHIVGGPPQKGGAPANQRSPRFAGSSWSRWRLDQRAPPRSRGTRHSWKMADLQVLKPSDGLEPSTPSLPCASPGNRSQPTATVFAYLSRFSADAICHRLPPIATTGLHKGSILSCRRRRHRRGDARRPIPRLAALPGRRCRHAATARPRTLPISRYISPVLGSGEARRTGRFPGLSCRATLERARRGAVGRERGRNHTLADAHPGDPARLP
jgi:hypothetical protein